MQSERKNGSGRQDVARAHMAKVWFGLSKRGSSQTQPFLTHSALSLLEGSSDFPALQRLTWAPVVHHTAHGLILSIEAKATDFTHLLRANSDGLLQNVPYHTLEQWRSGQWTRVCPVISACRKQSSGVKVCEGSLLSLGLNGVQSIHNFLYFRLGISYLHEDAYHSQTIRMLHSFSKFTIFYIPVNNMELCIILHTIHSVLGPLALTRSPVNVKLCQPVDCIQCSSLQDWLVGRIVKLHVEGVPVVDNGFSRAGIVAETERLQSRIVLGGLGADGNRGLALSLGNGEVLVPVSGSYKTA